MKARSTLSDATCRQLKAELRLRDFFQVFATAKHNNNHITNP
jgi:hypothetical protein